MPINLPLNLMSRAETKFPIIYWLHPKTTVLKKHFYIFFKRRINKEKTNKQQIIIIYLTNIAPSGLKYPN